MAAPSILTLKELTGKKRKLELYGAGLPFRGAAWSGEQKVVTKFNPGNLVGVQHVLGPREAPSEWEGYWNTTRLTRSPALYYDESGASTLITRASTLADIMDAFRITAAFLQVTWAGDAGRKIVRRGRIAELKLQYDRFDDIKWSARFDWVSRGDDQARVVTFRQENVNAESTAAIVAANELVASISSTGPSASTKGISLSANTFDLGDLERLADGPSQFVKGLAQFANNVVDRVKKVSDLVAKVGSMPEQLLSQLSDVAENAAAVFNQSVDELSRTVPDAGFTAPGVEAKASDLFKATVYFGTAQSKAEAAANAAADLGLKVRRTRSAIAPGGSQKDQAQVADMLAVYLSKQGDTFASISLRYYQTPDRAADVARANGFPLYQVAPPPGLPIVIPNLKAIDQPGKV